MFKKIDSKTIIICSIITLLLIGTFVFKADTFWITDGGNKYVVLRNFVQKGTLAIIPDYQNCDFNEFFPTGGFHFIPQESGVYRSVFPEYYAIINAPFWQMWGSWGLLVLQLLGAGGLTIFFTRFCGYFKWSNKNIAIANVALFFATPIAFYSWTFWEMVPSVAVMMFISYLVICKEVKWRYIGLLLGVGLFIRAEFYFVIGAMLGTLAFERRWRNIIETLSGFLVGATPIWIWQWLEFGHVLGLNGSQYHSHNTENLTLYKRVSQQLYNYYFYYFSFVMEWKTPLQMMLTVILGTSAILGCFRQKYKDFLLWKVVLIVIAIVVWAILALRFLQQQEMVIKTIFMVGVWATIPLLQLILLNLRALWMEREAKIRWISKFFIIYTLLIPPLLTANDLGIIWGARHWLILLPLAVFLAMYSAWRMGKVWTFVVLAVLGVVIQFGGWNALRVMTNNSAILTSSLRDNTYNAVVSDIYFLPEQTPEMFFEKDWLYFENDSAMDKFLKIKSLPENISLVVSAENRYRQLSNTALQKLMKIYRVEKPPITVDLKGSNFLNVHIFNLKLIH